MYCIVFILLIKCKRCWRLKIKFHCCYLLTKTTYVFKLELLQSNRLVLGWRRNFVQNVFQVCKYDSQIVHHPLNMSSARNMLKYLIWLKMYPDDDWLLLYSYYFYYTQGKKHFSLLFTHFMLFIYFLNIYIYIYNFLNMLFNIYIYIDFFFA